LEVFCECKDVKVRVDTAKLCGNIVGALHSHNIEWLSSAIAREAINFQESKNQMSAISEEHQDGSVLLVNAALFALISYTPYVMIPNLI
jgi:hypothetical protein